MLFPAHAGMNRLAYEAVEAEKPVPRTRGDEPLRTVSVLPVAFCSPHTRG